MHIYRGKKLQIQEALMSIIYCLVKCHLVVVTNLLIYSYVLQAIRKFLVFQKENKKPDIQCCVVVTFFTQIKAIKDIYSSNEIDMQDDEIK